MAEVTLTFNNLLQTASGAYAPFASKIIVFTFKGFTGMTRLNGELISNITTIPNTLANPKIETVSTYGVGAEWAIPSNNMGKFSYNGVTYYCVFGYVNSGGTMNSLSGTSGATLTISLDEAYLNSGFKLTGCKHVALTSRTDCGVVTSFSAIPSQAAGDIPVNTTA